MSRGRKRGSTKKIGDIVIPKPPREATHAHIATPNGGNAIVEIKDFDCLLGTTGKINFIRRVKGKTLKTWDELWDWDGSQILNLQT